MIGSRLGEDVPDAGFEWTLAVAMLAGLVGIVVAQAAGLGVAAQLTVGVIMATLGATAASAT